MEHLRFPIGHFVCPKKITKTHLNTWIRTIEPFPNDLEYLLIGVADDKLNTPYRPDGWTVRQAVHHCADSHLNSFCRFKLALTEDNPTIKPYAEDLWAELADTKTMPIQPSLHILQGVHWRWGVILKNLSANDLKRTFYHPENQTTTTLAETIGLYAWHCKHHKAHIGLVIK